VRPVPLTDIAALPGIAHAAASARDAVDVVLRQPSARRQAAVVAATSVVRGASASARLEGAEPDRTDDPLVLGALRATGAAVEMAGLWARAPLQVLARLHLLAAADLADRDTVGRPVDAEAARRLTGLVRDVGTSVASEVPAMVVAAVVHAEVAEAFAPAGGVVGRAAERVVLVSTGLDPSAMLVPEVGHLAEQERYPLDRRAFAGGGPLAWGRWVERCCRAYTRGAEETAAIVSG
jgi:hypothetical protein